MHIHTYVHTYVHSYINMYIHTNKHRHIHTRIHAYPILTYKPIQAPIKTQPLTPPHTYVHTCMLTYISHSRIPVVECSANKQACGIVLGNSHPHSLPDDSQTHSHPEALPMRVMRGRPDKLVPSVISIAIPKRGRAPT
jgi:hypothetical protein